MSIHFDAKRWDTVKETYKKWWSGELERPLYKLTIDNFYEPTRPAPKNALLTQENVNDFSITAEEIIDAMDYDLSKKEFLGDSFPFINFDSFGPGVLSAFCGANLDNSSGRVWFFPDEELEITDISIKYDPENKWVKRIKDVYRAGIEKWGDTVLMGMPDLGGSLDLIAVLRGTENLLMDLYDEPEEVLRLVKEADKAWFEAYNDLASVLYPQDGVKCVGYSDWDGIYSESPSYILQSDFSFNISTDMFLEFALDSIKEQTRVLDNTIYHLDGFNQVKNLDYLLADENLNAIQWVFGDGMPPAPHWIDIYKKIEDAKKGSHIIGSIEDFDYVAQRINFGLYYNVVTSLEDYNSKKELYNKYL